MLLKIFAISIQESIHNTISRSVIATQVLQNTIIIQIQIPIICFKLIIILKNAKILIGRIQ